MSSKSAIGIGNGICFKQVRDKGGGSHIDPLVRDSLVGVRIADQNTNESPTRNIIKNTIPMTLDETGEPIEAPEYVCPFPVYSGKELEDLLQNDNWKQEDDML